MDLALFDFDGTITTRETFADFLRFSAHPLRRWLGVPCFAPLVLGYRAGVVNPSLLRAAAIRFAFQGVSAEQVRQRGQDYAREIIPGLLRPVAMQRIAWHQARGDTVIVVSGALDSYLAPWCRQHQLQLICSSLQQRGDRLTGAYAGRQCVAEEKPRRVLAELDRHEFAAIHAYGDTAEDQAMLALADHRIYRWQRL
ncbi:HAD family hydrolase [Pseudoxanthomonas dokdonensis]|uniref:Hydrolase n=1 Tax=Pseudoxanthomonas dokdonensis TaxID=344882 RepID=A0A0R0CUC1_9GAMM|nr:HAD family hydrolase [Pseudoxanthomonas dokdonensis]KRG68867.1 hydrolase [Pseudoxanthomonas dokdonensis]